MSILPALSTEILRQICSNLPGSSALTFLRVCRSIHRACDDWTVWRAVIRNGGQYPGGIVSAGSGNREAWKRYVIAAVKVDQTQQHWGTKDFSRWLPQIAALGDPDIWQSAVPFLEHLCSAILHDATAVPHLLFDVLDLATRSSPVIAYAGLGQLCSAVLHDATAVPHPSLDVLDLATRSGPVSTHAWRLAQTSAFCLTMWNLSMATFPKADNGAMELLQTPDFVSLDQQSTTSSVDWQRHVVIQHSLANRAVGCAYAMICFDRAKRKAASQSLIGLACPPTSRTIPLQQLMDLPLPFSTSSLERFNKCHVLRMATPDFFTDDDWTGYRTSPGLPGYGIFVLGIGGTHHDGYDNPITGISAPFGDFPHGRDFEPVVRFQLVEERDNGLFVLQSNNFHSEFELHRIRLTVAPQSGLLTIQHWHPMRADFGTTQGAITPFGIVTYFDTKPGHWTWLWKVSWCGEE